MKLTDLFSNQIAKEEQESFKHHLVFDNIKRGKILACFLIFVELLTLMTDVIASCLRIDVRFDFVGYSIMYGLMILVNILLLIVIRKFEQLNQTTTAQLTQMERFFFAYITFMLCWGSIVTLMDQRLYGQLMAYLINVSICSVVYYLGNKKSLIPYILSLLILFIGLPFVQPSHDILFGHYVNLIIFASILWLTSRMIYHGYCENYKNTVLLNNSKRQLEEEIELNHVTNKKLSISNRQLKELTLIDELTGIPNRRSFRYFIGQAKDHNFENHKYLTIMMIDIDFFKQYNDHYGHDEGDKALVAVANEILSTIQSSMEFAVRWGGEEFIFAGLYEEFENAVLIAEDLRKRVLSLKIPHAHSKAANWISISVGVCTSKISPTTEIGKVIEWADKALYEAKNGNRNCVKTIEFPMDSEHHIPSMP